MFDDSPFLDVPRREWLASNASAFAIGDPQPVTPGHTLVVPRRELASWWDLSTDEKAQVWDLVDQVKRILDVRHVPDGYNVGFDVGAAAGQLVRHFHVHVIPRFGGGGSGQSGGLRFVASEFDSLSLPNAGTGDIELIDSADERLLKVELLRALITDAFDRIDILVSFIMNSGLNLLVRRLGNALERGATVRVLTTDYLNVTDPSAIARFLDLKRTAELTTGSGSLDIRVFADPSTSFHPKAYLFWSSNSSMARGFVGSNNLSQSGIAGGVEWSLGTSQLSGLVEAFDRLWADPRSQAVDDSWVAAYRQRREMARTSTSAADDEAVGDQVLADEPPTVLPTPRPIQSEALAALEQTREGGHAAGLVVLATGLGKTWLAAFDSNRREFPRVLFVAHRDEILSQARDVFRAVRPTAELGFFSGAEKSPSADVVFASVQTLWRHLGSFGAADFEYIVVDEFHHASAATYRRVLNHFEPRFLLGLTATPDRLDGADLLALCGDNLVYRCDLVRGIKEGELSPFHYWGVADTVDFRPIPWRNGRFEPAGLDEAVITTERADAAFREWSARAGGRTLAFCVSIRHADYMAAYFGKRGVPSVSLHSKSEPGLRERAVERLESGDLKVLFTVDLFNEGVDVPTIDTVLMLRPTESPVLFLQQLGRGLRVSDDKAHLEVVDFVGNHRSFLAPLRTLLSLRLGRLPTRRELDDALRDGNLVLADDCSVDYSLEAIDLLTSLVKERRPAATDALRDLCVQLAEEEGQRPSALQIALAGGSIRAAKRRAGGWFDLLRDLQLLDASEAAVLASAGELLRELETTAMKRSFKMVTLEALLHDGRLLSGMPVGDLAVRSLKLIQADPRLSLDVDENEFPRVDVVEASKWQRYWERNPIAAWSGGPWFSVDGGQFTPTFEIDTALTETFEAMVAEMVAWRLHDYLERGRDAAQDAITLRVSHSGGSPILRFDRSRDPAVPEGIVEFEADGEVYVGRFVKIALNTATLPGGDANVLPSLLRRWFGPSAGHPGTDHRVILRQGAFGWTMAPSGRQVIDTTSASLPHFPTYAIACGAFSAPVPADVAPHRLKIRGSSVADPDEFLVTVRGDSMAGGEDPVRHGDVVRFRWAKGRSPEDFVGRRVLVELRDTDGTKPVLKTLARNDNGYALSSTAAGYPDIAGTTNMTIVGELIDRVDPSLWNPLGDRVGEAFTRQDTAPLFGVEYNFGSWGQSGHVGLPDDTVLFVTLVKDPEKSGAEYVDRFESSELFHWTSQSTTAPEGKRGREITDALDTGRRIHLFVRRDRSTSAFLYCGLVVPLRHEGSKPMTVWFRMLTPLDRELQRALLVDA